MMHDSIVHLADHGVFIQQVQDVLRQIPAHEQVWSLPGTRPRRCRRRARIAATLMWGPSLFPIPPPQARSPISSLCGPSTPRARASQAALVLSGRWCAPSAPPGPASLAARRIPVMEAPPPAAGRGRLPVTALRLHARPHGRAVLSTFSIEHPRDGVDRGRPPPPRRRRRPPGRAIRSDHPAAPLQPRRHRGQGDRRLPRSRRTSFYAIRSSLWLPGHPPAAALSSHHGLRLLLGMLEGHRRPPRPRPRRDVRRRVRWSPSSVCAPRGGNDARRPRSHEGRSRPGGGTSSAFLRRSACATPSHEGLDVDPTSGREDVVP